MQLSCTSILSPDTVRSKPIVQPTRCACASAHAEPNARDLDAPLTSETFAAPETYLANAGCAAFALLNAGMTSLAKRSSCSSATASGTPTERLTEMRSIAG